MVAAAAAAAQYPFTMNCVLRGMFALHVLDLRRPVAVDALQLDSMSVITHGIMDAHTPYAFVATLVSYFSCAYHYVTMPPGVCCI